MSMFKYLFLILYLTCATAQDSLYLLNSIIGNTSNRLYNAKAAGDLKGDGFADFAVIFEDSTYIYFGNTSFELKPDFSIYQLLSFTGDINKDGYADFLFAKSKNGIAII